MLAGKICLDPIEEEKDLGVIINKTFKVSSQCATAAKKSNQVFGMITRTFICRNKVLMMKLYKALVRPHLEYSIQAWRPHLQKDIDILEKVQRRFTRLISECKGLSYEHRLKILNITTLETRRLRADLLEVYKIVSGIEGLEIGTFFEFSYPSSSAKTRGHSRKFFKHRFKSDIGKFSFGNRVVDIWNGLPEDIALAEGINSFKSKIDRYLRNIKGLI